MKSLKSTLFTKNYFTIMAIAVVIFSFSACAKKISFQTSSVVPAARGSVKVKKDNNSNYRIQIKLFNLAEVKRLDPPKQAYVVWMESDQQAVKNMGQINSSNSMLSKTLKASFETVTAFKPIKIFITAEDDAAVLYPGMQLVLSTSNF